MTTQANESMQQKADKVLKKCKYELTKLSNNNHWYVDDDDDYCSNNQHNYDYHTANSLRILLEAHKKTLTKYVQFSWVNWVYIRVNIASTKCTL